MNHRGHSPAQPGIGCPACAQAGWNAFNLSIEGQPATLVGTRSGARGYTAAGYSYYLLADGTYREVGGVYRSEYGKSDCGSSSRQIEFHNLPRDVQQSARYRLIALKENNQA